MLKSLGVVGGWVVAWSNLVSAQGPLVLGLGPGLDNIFASPNDPNNGFIGNIIVSVT